MCSCDAAFVKLLCHLLLLQMYWQQDTMSYLDKNCSVYFGIFILCSMSKVWLIGNWTTRGLDNSRTSQLADWTTRGLAASASCPVHELSSNRLIANPPPLYISIQMNHCAKHKENKIQPWSSLFSAWATNTVLYIPVQQIFQQQLI